MSSSKWAFYRWEMSLQEIAQLKRSAEQISYSRQRIQTGGHIWEQIKVW